jgi:GT2 family glycosyltransferase
MADSISGVSTALDVGVVVVAHNPGKKLADLCTVLCPQAPVVIVDNASTSGTDILRSCASLGAEVLRLECNTGVAGGLSKGHAHFRNREWILTFDQDSVVGPDFLPTLASSPELSEHRVAMLGPTVVDADAGGLLQSAPLGDARFLITSGALCRVEALDDVGGFRPELFIDHVDHDVCLRLRRRGWRLRITDEVVMRHSIGAMRDHHLIGRLSVRNSHHTPDRQYYKYRNFVLLVRDGTALVDRRWIARAGAALAWGPVKIVFFEEAKVAKVRAALAGVWDGLRGVTGPRPSTARPARHGQDMIETGPLSAASARRPRALLIAPPFFGYYRHIAEGLEKRGYEVDHFNDHPSQNPLLKAAIRVRPRLVDSIVKRYLDHVLSQTQSRDYDLVLVVNGKVLTPWFVERLLKDHPRARSVLYLWDAIGLYPHTVDQAPYFDRRFTFDPSDARDQRDFALLPLFFTDDCRSVGDSELSNTDFDIMNVCTAHPNRYSLMKLLIPRLRHDGLAVFSYLYIHPLRYVYDKLKSEAFAGARIKEFKFRPLAASQYLQVLQRSKAVLDVNHSGQTGLTIRTIETIGARRKLITTNAEVVKYALYHPSRILVVEHENFDSSTIREFIAQPQVPLDPSTYELFGLDEWLTEIIQGDGSRHESVLDQ